jgi:ankyrin repeat protein
MLASRKKRLDICGDCKRAASPAIQAASLGHTNCLVTAYRELGVFNERDDYGATPIHFAARNGKLDCLEWLVTRSGVSPTAVTVNGNTAAHEASATGHINCLQYLLQNTKCSLTDTTSEGASVLHIASRFGQTEVVKWLVENMGCLPGDKGANNVTPVHLSAAKSELGGGAGADVTFDPCRSSGVFEVVDWTS